MIYREDRQKLLKVLDYSVSSIGLIIFSCFVALIGFELSNEIIFNLRYFIKVLIVLFLVEEVFRFLIAINKKHFFKRRRLEFAFVLLLLFNLLAPDLLLNYISDYISDLSVEELTIINLLIIQSVFIIIMAIKVLRYNNLISKIKLHPSAIFALSFAFIILSGALALLLPKATYPDKSISFVDALFTSTSAVCVTGLTVVDTPSTFTTLGKIVIMLLIQIGGLGVMTLTTFFSVYLTGSLSIGTRVMLKEFLSNEGISDVTDVIKKIAYLTFSIEAVGAVVIYFSLGGTIYPFNTEYLFSSVFHAISAFCNAGFSLYSDNLMSMNQSTYYIFPTMVMILIVFGGLGFGVMSNILALRPHSRMKKKISIQLSAQSKLVITMTLILIFGGGVLIYLTEPFYIGQSLSELEKFYHSIFFSVSARTAGFNTTPSETLKGPATLLLIILMWVGASPGSTGGGIKTTTFGVAVLSFVNLIKGKHKINVFNRHIHNDDVRRSFLIIFASLIALGIGSILLTMFEPEKQPIDLIFEATSALSTVGLSRNITYYIGDPSKLVLISLMYIGRIGVLNFFLSFFAPPPEPKYTLPRAGIMLG